MSTLAEVEMAVKSLSKEDKRKLYDALADELREARKPESDRQHSVRDIPTFSGRGLLMPLTADDDLLDEMLEHKNFGGDLESPR